MNDLRGRFRLPHIAVTTGTLEWYGGITMLFYSLSMSVIQNGLLHVHQYTNTQLRELMIADPERMLLSGWAVVFQLLGGLAIPVFAFLAVEAFLHTEDFRKTLLGAAGLALISEIPFDLAMSGRVFDWTSQNMLLSLAIGLVMLYGLRMFTASRGAQVLIVLAALLWSGLMKTGFGLCLILLMAVYYLLREKPKAKWILSSLIGLMYVTGPLSNLALKRYGWQPDKPGSRLLPWLYPLHLLVLAAICYLIK